MKQRIWRDNIWGTPEEMQDLSGKFGTYQEVERPVLAKKNEQNWIKGILMIKGQSERGKKSKDMI